MCTQDPTTGRSIQLPHLLHTCSPNVTKVQSTHPAQHLHALTALQDAPRVTHMYSYHMHTCVRLSKVFS